MRRVGSTTSTRRFVKTTLLAWFVCIGRGGGGGVTAGDCAGAPSTVRRESFFFSLLLFLLAEIESTLLFHFMEFNCTILYCTVLLSYDSCRKERIIACDLLSPFVFIINRPFPVEAGTHKDGIYPHRHGSTPGTEEDTTIARRHLSPFRQDINVAPKTHAHTTQKAGEILCGL